MKKIILICINLLLGTLVFAQTLPIVVQPSSGLNDGSDEGGINSGKDAWANEAEIVTNYGASEAIVILPTSNCNATKVNGYIQFDLSTLPVAVDSVLVGFLHGDHTNYCLSNCDADFYFAYVTSTWDEMTLNYTNMPTQGNDFFGPINITFPNSFGTREYNITTAYNSWKSGTLANNGFLIHSPSVGCNNACVYFIAHSSDDTVATNRPYLKVYPELSSSIIDGSVIKLNSAVITNPIDDICTIKLFSGIAQTAKIELYDTSGKLCLTKSQVLQVGNNTIEIGFSQFTKGLYNITIMLNQGETIHHKLVKQ